MFSLLLLLATQTPTNVQTYSPAVDALIADRANLASGELIKRLEALANGGDLSAAEALGEFAQHGGSSLPRNPTKACDWYARAAGERADSTHNLALCFKTENGRPRDAARARTLYGVAAAKGWIQAKCALGTMLVRGLGGPADAPRGVALCREAAVAGNAHAQTDYANYLLMGEGVSKDVVEARRWYTAAAEQNQPNAALVLGQICWNGDGVVADYAAAERWWRVAHDHGRADAAGLIVQAVFRRMITTRDGKQVVDRSMLPEAVHWLRIAAEKEPDPARRATFAETLKALTAES
ncbi:MAG: sel1 repeat family protein [Sphingomonadales bacterium]|nr:MAG: sel1 repeat family protein [Sphingomonadales bacterium]